MLSSAILVLALVCIETTATKNFSVINPEVDAVLKQGPDWVYDLLAALAIALGAIFAFFGLKTVRVQSTFYGAFISGAGASFILFLVPGQESAAVWLGVVLPVAVIGGYLIGRIVVLRKVTLFIALGTAVAGVFNQYALSYFSIVPEWLIWSIMAVALVISAILIWRYFHLSAILATAFLGGFIVLLATARLMRGEISLIGMWIDPEFMVGCLTLSCWIPFLVGTGTFIVGSLFQICMRRREKKAKNIADENQEGIEDTTETTRLTPAKQTPRRTPITKGKPGNPFTPEPNDDPLIMELTQTLNSRERRRRINRDINEDIALA